MNDGVLSTAIVTVDPHNQGGVRTMMTTIYGIAKSWRMNPRLFHIICDPPLPSKKRLFGLRSYATERLGMRSFTMPSFPVAPWLWNLIPLLFGWRAIHNDGVHIAVGGSSHVALLLAVKRLPYILWVATLYEDELRAKADAGDRWAERLLHSPGRKILQVQETLCLRRATRILALSPHTAARIREQLPDIADRVDVMTFPVDTGHYYPDPGLRERPECGKYLLFVARINDPRKNVEMLCYAFREIRRKHPELKLVLAGDEPNASLTGLVRKLDPQDAMIFPGALEPKSEELRQFYQGAQLFVLPSYQEGLGIVALEAMACGIPIVSTQCGGTDGIVIDNQTGRLVPNNNASAMAQAVMDLLEHPELVERMRAECIRVVRQNYSQMVKEDQLWRTLNELFPQQLAQLQGTRVIGQASRLLESVVNE
jgi:glycosyltransferase involved in cell wall biosynthesis